MEKLQAESNVKKKVQPKYSAEMRARAVWMVLDHLRHTTRNGGVNSIFIQPPEKPKDHSQFLIIA
uniref:hypothetical protein n=1 Tax=Burkholderia arboris TaxID=488730 RepID=UPI003BEEFCD9